MRKLLTCILCLLFTACGQGNRDETNVTKPDPKVSQKSKLGSDFKEFKSKHPSEVPGIESVFALSEGNIGAFVAFYTNNRVFSGVAQRVSAKVYNMQGTVGYYEEKEGRIFMSAKKTTCRAHLKGERSKIFGSTTGEQIVITNTKITLSLKRYSTGASKPKDFAIRWGCFVEGKPFYPEPWSDL